MNDPRRLLITGATSGIGAALARHWAAPGRTLYLCGRDDTRLVRTLNLCREGGADARGHVLDVTDGKATAAWVAEAEREGPLDLVVANAGVSRNTLKESEPTLVGAELDRRLFAINVDGVVNTLVPAIAAMTARHRGHIAVTSSLAAFRGLPGAPAYCASKAAVKVYAEGLRPRLLADGVGLTVICPGFVTSRITDKNRFSMPFLMDADRAARIIARAIARKQAVIAFPWPSAVMARIMASLPRAWIDPYLARLPREE